ncbi:MAG: putative archaeal flagellar protein F [uncultured archaeon A07HN63]|jgi:Putative archaeal flagellar protein F|nr:MAG: putative archaeal flagellar protein F [uncultured archaeon A07HN63]
MGFSISAATALIFASLFLAFGIFYPAMANGYERVEEADAAKADQNLDQAQTDITFVSSSSKTQMGQNKLQELIVNINNTGQTTLTVSEIDILVNGDYIEWTNGDTNDEVRTEVENDQVTDLWLPGETIEIEYGAQTGFVDKNPPYNYKIVTEHGVSISGVES